MSEPTLAELGFTPASMDYTEFESGRPDKFRGYIDDAVSFPYKGKSSKDGKYGLVVAAHIVPDPDSGFEPFWEPLYGAARLSKALPSKDNETPAGATAQQYLQLAAGRTSLDRPVINENGIVDVNHDNVGRFVLGAMASERSWAILCRTAHESDKNGLIPYPPPRGALDFMNNIWMRFDRVPSKYEDSSGKEQVRYDLSVTQVFERVSEAGATSSSKESKKGSSSKPAASAASAASSDGSSIGEDITKEINKYLLEKKGGPVGEEELMNEIAKRMKNSGHKRIAIMTWIMEKDSKTELPTNLGAIEGTTYNPNEKTLAIE